MKVRKAVVCKTVEGPVRYREGKNKGTKYKKMGSEREEAIYTNLGTL
jgi:hypothetical protein